MRITPPAHWSSFKLVVQTAAPDGDVVNLLDDFDQGFEHFEKSMLAIETATTTIQKQTNQGNRSST